MATSKKVASRLTEIPDHLLAEIFIRLPATEDLSRTSAACSSFHQLVTDRSFIRRFRRLHAPPLLGFLDHNDFKPAIPPHPSASGAQALALVGDFSFSFLPSHCRWSVQDTRDGRVLLAGTVQDTREGQELVVCDPLHRRYILLPPVPDDLLSMVPAPHSTLSPCEPFLVPLSEEETAAAAEDTAFRVIYMVHCNINLSAFVFSSSTGEWRAATSKAWDDLFHGHSGLDINHIMPKLDGFFLRRSYAYGYFYWDGLPLLCKKMIVLDTRRMEFSMADLPPGSLPLFVIAEAGEGRLGVLGFDCGMGSDLSYTIVQNQGKSPSQFQMEKIISLDSGYNYHITYATERYLLLARTKASYVENRITEYFSMDIKTLKLHMVCAKQGTDCILTNYLRIYSNFPPYLLSSPTI